MFTHDGPYIAFYFIYMPKELCNSGHPLLVPSCVKVCGSLKTKSDLFVIGIMQMVHTSNFAWK